METCSGCIPSSGIRPANVCEQLGNTKQHRIFPNSQLFSYRIGQAQTFEGAKITSTNTDGLFSVMESTLNDQILARESADIGVEIEPEPTYLISKDTNNRIEMDPKTGEVQAASGGTLGCRNWAGKKGPSPSKNLSHPAIIDWALCEYLVFAATDRSGRASLDKPFNPEVGLNILLSAKKKMPQTLLLNMFQNVIASSTGSIRYNFARKPGRPEPIPLQHYNRVFIMKDGTPETVHLNAANAKKLTPVQIKNREKNEEKPQQHDETAAQVLQANGVTITKIPEGYEATVIKLTNIEDTWFMLIENHALKYLDDARVNFILDNLDYGKYLYLLGNSFENSWRNILPNSLPKTDMTPFTKDLDAAMKAYKAGTLSELSAKKTAKTDPKPVTPHIIKPRPEPADATEQPPAESTTPPAVTAAGPADPTELPWTESPKDAQVIQNPDTEPVPAQPEISATDPGTKSSPEPIPTEPESTTADTGAAPPPVRPEPVTSGQNGQMAIPGWEPEQLSPAEKAHRSTLLTMLTSIQQQCRLAGDYIKANPDLAESQDYLDHVHDILDQEIQHLSE